MNKSDLHTRWAWSLRQTFPGSLPVWRRRRTLAALWSTLSPTQQPAAEKLAARYDLSNWGNCCDIQGFRESLYVLDVLDHYFGPARSPTPALDIGCKDGGYLPGLRAWSSGPWDGVELDAHRRYWTLTTRRAKGEAIARSLPDCRYIAGNLLDIHRQYGFITWFLPFLHDAPLVAWGLPRRFLMPQTLLEHAWKRLLPGGGLLIINQGEAEAERQARLFQAVGINAQALGRVDSPLSPFQKPRFGWQAVAS